MSHMPPISAAPESAAKPSLINPAGLYDPAPNGYSHAARIPAGARLVFIAGQGGEYETGSLSPDFGDQVRQAYANLKTALFAAGSAPDRVAKLTTYAVDYHPGLLPVMTRELKAVFGDHLPVQTLVAVSRLALDGMLFEVDAVAVAPPG